MVSVLFGFVLDILVLGFLSAVIYYAIRLSKSLDNFKSHKAEMKSLIANLTKNIDQAQSAIDGLKLTGDNAGKNLQGVIGESRMLFDELQIMNEAGNSLAGRLESLAGQAGAHDRGTSRGNLSLSGVVDISHALEDGIKHEDRGDGSFCIQDRDFEDSAGPPADDDFSWREEDIPDDLQSQAEKELFQALQKNKKEKSSAWQR